jgi:hypothetical protein
MKVYEKGSGCQAKYQLIFTMLAFSVPAPNTPIMLENLMALLKFTFSLNYGKGWNSGEYPGE